MSLPVLAVGLHPLRCGDMFDVGNLARASELGAVSAGVARLEAVESVTHARSSNSGHF